MAAVVAATVRNYHFCARNRVNLKKHLNRLKSFLATRPLEDAAVDILGPPSRTRSGKQFLVVISGRFTRFPHTAALWTIKAHSVAMTFSDVRISKYGISVYLLTSNGPQSALKLFPSVCRVRSFTNLYTGTYHLQTNGQVKRYNRTLAAMLRNYVIDHQDDLDEYASALTYTYNCHVHRSTGTKPFVWC